MLATNAFTLNLPVYILLEMNLSRAKQMASVLATILSLVASSIAACACDHHSIKSSTAPAEASCHGAAHTEPLESNNLTEAASGDRFETGCNCLVVDSGPSAVSGSRSLADVSDASPAEPVDVSVVRIPVLQYSRPAYFPFSTAEYNLILSTSAPARAPPRL